MHSETRTYRTGGEEVVLDLTRDAADVVSGRGDGWRRSATCCRRTTAGGTATALPGTAART